MANSNRWKSVKIKEVAKISSGTTPARKNAKYFDHGEIPWVKTTDLNNGLVTETEENVTPLALKETSLRIYPKGTVLVAMYGGFNQIGRTGILGVEATINQALSALSVNKDETDPLYLLFWLNANVRLWRNLAGSSRKDPNISSRDVGDFPFARIPMTDQRAIVRVLATMDKLLHKSTRLIEQKKLRKRYLTQTLLTGKKRLKEFRGKWKTLPFRELATESVFRNGGKMSNDRLMAVYKVHGMIPMRERVQGESNHRCKIVRRNYFAYNPMRLNIGSLARWDGNEPAMVSGDYVVFKCEEERLDPRFFDFYRSTNEWVNYVRRAGDGSVRVRIYFSHLAPLKITLPAIEEQKAIANILDIATCEITMLEAKSELLKMEKRWLMQQLLTGKKRLKLEEE